MEHDKKTKYTADYVPNLQSQYVLPNAGQVPSLLTFKTRDPAHRIFVNKSLHLENIKYYGFDMDYTIAEYTSPFYEKLIFDMGKERLVEMGYPTDILEFEYDPSFPVRGLWFDSVFGNLLKTDAFGNILICVHGFDFLKSPEIEALYPNKFLKFHERRVYPLHTLFHLPEMYLLACLMDYFTNSIQYTKEGNTGVRSGPFFFSFKSIYQDVRNAVGYLHSYGGLKKRTVENVQMYVKKNTNIPLAFHHIHESGAKIFLLTNSDFNYTNSIMTYLFDYPHGPTENDAFRDWKTYFDIIICDACKPDFFHEGTVLRQVDPVSGDLRIGTHVGPLQRGQIYSGGSCEVFMQLIGATGSDVLYFGDHVFGDILKSKKVCGWRTFLIVPELIRELEVWTNKCELFTELQTFDVILGDIYKDLDSSTKEKPDISNVRSAIREVTHRMDLAYGMMGSIFRSGSRQTAFSDQVVRYADLYAATLQNLIYYPLSYMFRAPAMLVPHESTVAHEQKMKPVEHIISRKRTPSMEKTYHKSLLRVHSVVPNIMPSRPKRITHTHDEDFLETDDEEVTLDSRDKSNWQNKLSESVKAWDEVHQNEEHKERDYKIKFGPGNERTEEKPAFQLMSTDKPGLLLQSKSEEKNRPKQSPEEKYNSKPTSREKYPKQNPEEKYSARHSPEENYNPRRSPEEKYNPRQSPEERHNPRQSSEERRSPRQSPEEQRNRKKNPEEQRRPKKKYRDEEDEDEPDNTENTCRACKH